MPLLPFPHESFTLRVALPAAKLRRHPRVWRPKTRLKKGSFSYSLDSSSGVIDGIQDQVHLSGEMAMDEIESRQEVNESSAIKQALAYGIDITLLIENLRRSPTERLRRHHAMLEFVEELRRAGERRKEIVTASGRDG